MEIFNKISKISELNPDKNAIISVDKNQKIKYKELIINIESRVAKLKYLNFKKNQLVGICIENDAIENIYYILALNKICCTILPIDNNLKNQQIQKILKKLKVNVLLTNTNRFTNYELFIINTNNLLDNKSLEKNINSKYDNKVYNFLITLSSGSTGDPKPIVFTEKNKILRSIAAKNEYKLNKYDVILNASPFHHSLGQRLTFLPLLMGGTLVILERFNVENWISAVKNYKISFTIAVSTHLNLLLEKINSSDKTIKSLRKLVSSSAAISNLSKEKLAQNQNFEFYEMYGASEVATVSSFKIKEYPKKISTVGKICSNVEVKIINNKNIECKEGEIGEITVHSQTQAFYYQNKSKKIYYEGKYFKTGDLGYIDSEKFLTYVGRKKDVIISGGINIYPSDIENEMLKLDFIIECCVIGISDTYFGECVVMAYTSNSINHNKNELRMREHARNNLANFQQPLKYFYYEKLPKLSSGKINKISLKNQLNKIKLNISSKIINLL